MKSKKIFTIFLAIVLMVGLVGCSKPPTLVSIAVPSDQLELETGQTKEVALAMTFTEEDVTEAQIADAIATAGLTWESDNLNVAAVEPNDSGGGTIKAISPGEANVEVSGGDALTTTIKVTVADPTVSLESITVSATLELVIKGESFGSAKIGEGFKPANATVTEVSYVSDNTDVVTVDKSGTVTAVAVGTASVTLTAVGADAEGNPVEKTAVTKVTVVIGAEAIELDSYEGWIYVGDAYMLEPFVSPAEAPAHTYTFASSDESVATVSEEGDVVGKGAGSATITITSAEDHTLSIAYNVTVKKYSAPAQSAGGGSAPSSPVSPSAPSTPSTPSVPSTPEQPTAPPAPPAEQPTAPPTPPPEQPPASPPAELKPGDPGYVEPYTPLTPGDPTRGGEVGGM